MMIDRQSHYSAIGQLLRQTPIVGLLGTRQVGKTTLARQIANIYGQPTLFLDMEDPAHLARLADPKLALQNHRGLIVIDEVQRRPDLFPLLRVLADREEQPAKFLILGSAGPDLLRQSSESLAGRISYYELRGFGINEVPADGTERLWLRGAFPRSYLAESLEASYAWRRSFIQTFLERDIPALGIRTPSATLQRFWRMLAHYHGQLWNGAELARAFGVTGVTVRRYLDVLTSTLVLRQLQPWHENVGKRQVRSPKVYLTDAGLLHNLLAIQTQEDLLNHPKVGASWEGYVLGELLGHLKAYPEEAFFWSTYSGAELDLLIVRGNQKYGYEIKRTTSPQYTRSMRSASETLGLNSLDIVHAGDATFRMADNMRGVAFSRLLTDISPLR